MNLEELKRKIDEFQDATRSCAIHGDKEAYAEEVEATKDALLTAILAKLEAQQAKIDALMLEYCPDEMTPEQKENWGKNQGSANEPG